MDGAAGDTGERIQNEARRIFAPVSGVNSM